MKKENGLRNVLLAVAAVVLMVPVVFVGIGIAVVCFLGMLGNHLNDKFEAVAAPAAVEQAAPLEEER